MMHQLRLRCAALVACTLLVGLAASPALATESYPDYMGPTVTFSGIQETTQLAVDSTDPEPLFGSPTGVGDSLLFFPPAFTASSTNGVNGGDPANGDTDNTLSQLQVEITAHAVGTFIEEIKLLEAGDSILTGVGAATSTVSMSGVLTVLEDSNGPLGVPVQINFSSFLSFELPADGGSLGWSLNDTIDVASQVANATRVQLSLNNYLQAISEDGTSSTIQKKSVGTAGLTITVPEPTSLALIGLGLLGAGLLGRRRQ